MAVDTFTNGDVNPLPSPWATWGAPYALKEVGGQCAPAFTGSDTSAMLYSGGTANYSAITIGATGSNGCTIWACINCQGTLQGYGGVIVGTNAYIQRINGGTTNLKTGTVGAANVAGDVIAIKRGGDDKLYLYRNGTQILVTDSADTTYTGGAPGIMFYAEGDGRVSEWTDVDPGGGGDATAGLGGSASTTASGTAAPGTSIGL